MSATRYIVLGFAAAASAALLGACSQGAATTAQAQQSEVVEDLLQRVQHLEDITAIQKLQSKYTHYLFTQDFEKIPEEVMAMDSPDVSVEFSDSGVYRGPESVRRLYNAFAQMRKNQGQFILHTTVNPYIEIAADGQSARSHWLSPGASGSNRGASWIWGPYYIDYVKQDGEWRILRSNFAALFRNPYEVSWAKATDHGTVKGFLPEPDAPSTIYRPYNEVKTETDIFRNHPDLPEPY